VRSAISAAPSSVPSGARAARIALYCPSLPPAQGGVADHTVLLARALAGSGADVAVLGRTGEALGGIETVLGVTPLGEHGLAATAVGTGAGFVLIQYVPFLYARFGLAPWLVMALRALRGVGVRIGLFVHEPYVPFTRPSWWVTGWPMRWQLRALVRLSDVVCASVPAFLEAAGQSAREGARLLLLPVGSTIPVVPGSRTEARAALGLDPSEIAIGVFSPGASGLRRDWVARAALALGGQVRWIFFGRHAEAPPVGFPARAPARCLGWVAPEKASAIFGALDIAAQPFVDGLTLRRTSAMAALAHGVPLVSARGPLFDPSLDGAAVCAPTEDDFVASLTHLVETPALREAQGQRGREFYTGRGSTEVAAGLLLGVLGSA
jgi:glycosyltransferase involved in cell wall biosynthesis